MSQGKGTHQTIDDGSLYAPFALIIDLDSGVKAFWRRVSVPLRFDVFNLTRQ